MITHILCALLMSFPVSGMPSSLAPQTGGSEAGKIVQKSPEEMERSVKKKIAPNYSPIARLSGIQGEVPVELVIDRQGHVVSARALGGHPLLRDLARDALMQWVFNPTIVDGSPAQVTGIVTVKFGSDSAIGPAKSEEQELSALRQLVENNPQSPDAHYRLAEGYRRYFHYQDAIEQYREAARLEPNLAAADFGIGEAFYSQHRYELASEAFKQVIGQRPGCGEARLRLADCYRSIGHLSDAEVALLELVKQHPNDKLLESAYASLAIVSEELGRDGQAIGAYRELLLIARRSPSGSALLDYYAKRMAELYVKNGRYREAIAAYKQALEVASTVTEACWVYADMASLYEKLGDYRRAVGACRKMVNLEPGRPDWHLTLGRLYLRLGKQKSASREYQLLKRLDQDMANELLNEIQRH